MIILLQIKELNFQRSSLGAYLSTKNSSMEISTPLPGAVSLARTVLEDDDEEKEKEEIGLGSRIPTT